MPRGGSGRTTKAARDRRALLDALDGTEAKQLLGALLESHPELVMEAAGRAEEQLGAATAEDVAEALAFELDGLSVEDIWERAGSHADGSYLEPTEAAWEVVEEAVAPFLADLTRRVGLGRRAEATAICQGMLLALYRASEGNGEFLDGHAEGTLEEAAHGALETWKKGVRGRAGSAARPQELAALRDFVSTELPEWSSFLGRALGGPPARPRGRRTRR